MVSFLHHDAIPGGFFSLFTTPIQTIMGNRHVKSYNDTWKQRNYPVGFAYDNFVPLGWADRLGPDSFFRLQFYYFDRRGVKDDPYDERATETVLFQIQHVWSGDDDPIDPDTGCPRWMEVYHEASPEFFRDWLWRGVEAGETPAEQAGEVLFALDVEQGGR